MKYYKEKIFWKNIQDSKECFVEEWQETTEDYYSFVRRQTLQKHHQVAVTSDMMLELISEVATDPKINISKIEMLEENSEDEAFVNKLINDSKTNRLLLINLIEKLRYLSEDSSVEIKRAYFVEKTDNDLNNIVFVQVNGLIGFNKQSRVIDHLMNIVKRHID